MISPPSPVPTERPAPPADSVGRAVLDDTSTLLWEPFTDWEYRPEPEGYVEDLGAPEIWTWERVED